MSYILKDYDEGLKTILKNGLKKESRAGDIISYFGLQGRYDISEYFPIPTRRKYFYKSIIKELLWMLSGSTDIEDLEKLGSKIWTPWKDQSFIEKNNYKGGEVGPIYGFQFRNYGGDYSKPLNERGGVDQVKYVMDTLKEDKFSRRAMINLWNPKDVTEHKMILPPCHYSFQLLIDKNDNLTGVLNQRSGDWLPGVSANIVFYSAFIYMIAQQLCLKPKELIHNVSDAHVYVDQIDAANEYLKRDVFTNPKLFLNKKDNLFDYSIEDFNISNFNHGDILKIKVSV